MRCRLTTSFILPLVASMLGHEVQGSSANLKTNQETVSPRNSRFNYGGYVYTVGGYYPGGGGYYPGGNGGGYPGIAGGYPVQPGRGMYPSRGGGTYPWGTGGEVPVSGGDGKIPEGVPVDDEVEVFDVPGSNQGGYPGGGYPGGGYPSGGYPGGGYYPG